MKILSYTDTFFPKVGGAEMVLHNLATHLSAGQEEIHVLAPRARRNRNSQDHFSYPVHRYGEPSSKRFLVRQTLFHLIWLQLRHRFDILHCHAAYPQAYIGATFKKIFHRPVVVRPHGSDIVPGGRMRRNARLEQRVRFSLEAADAVIAQGNYLKEVVCELGIDQGKVKVINNGVDLAGFSFYEPFSHPRPYIVTVGNLIHRKGYDILLKAYSYMKGQIPDLLIAGSGPEEQNLKKMAAELGIEDKVRFLGVVSGQDKINLYTSARFFVCSSRKEPFANVILEAFAAGLPVIATEVDGNIELVHHEKNGLLFPVDDHAALADSLKQMTCDENLIAKLRKSVPPFVQQFGWPVVSARYLELYKNVAEVR